LTTTITAALTLSQNGYTTSDFATSDVEAWIDDAIITTATLVNTDIDKLDTGTVTLTDDLASAVKVLITIMLREAKKTSMSNSTSTSSSAGGNKSVGIGGLSVSESSSVSTAISAASSLNNQANTPLVDLYYRLVDALKVKYESSGFRLRFSVAHATS
jgi:hypothetical protein